MDGTFFRILTFKEWWWQNCISKWLYLMLAFVVHYGIGVESVVVLPVEQCVKGSSERAWQPLQYVISPTLHVKLVFRIQLVVHLNFVDGGTAHQQRGMIKWNRPFLLPSSKFNFDSNFFVLKKRAEIAKIMNWRNVCNAKKVWCQPMNFLNSDIQIN